MKTKYFVFEMLDTEKQFKGYAICEPFLVKEMLVKRISSREIIDISLNNYVYSKKHTKELKNLNMELGPKSARMIELALEDLREHKQDNTPKKVLAFKEPTRELLG